MHKLSVLAILVLCQEITHAPTSTAAATDGGDDGNDVNIFEFIGTAFLKFINDTEDPNAPVRYDLTKEVPLIFFNFIAGREDSSNGDGDDGDDQSGLGHMLAKGILDILDSSPMSDVTLHGNENNYTYENVDVMKFLFNSFFRYITDTEDSNSTANFNVYEAIFKTVFNFETIL